ncbi:hypothetical protein EJ04DRAFT_559100 [Polyplosphaeria fusca]|uniref:Uncharacterized protein n=1 Tax=Polyplosphaeria fusca TaxID=682080 RepID=A0A9P4V6Q7_9PLEO|nr:hypothetical protein EJ04DRAFT_559100 [Polyplosphaeria fusca]
MAQHPYNLRPEAPANQSHNTAAPTLSSDSTQTIVPSTPIPPPVSVQLPGNSVANQQPPIHAPAPTPESLEELRRQNEAEQIAYDREMRPLQLQEMRERIRAQQRAAGAIVEDDEVAQGASPKDLSDIVRHKFNPWNLARLRTGVGQRHLDQHGVTRIDSVTQQLVLKRSVGSVKDFGSDSSV